MLLNCLRLVLALCTLAAVPAMAEKPIDFHGAIQPLIERRCTQCHSDSGVSFSLARAEESWPMRDAIASAVGDGRMPPWLAEPGHQEYVGDYSLNDEEKALFATWARDGFPKGEPSALETRTPPMDLFEPDVSFPVIPGGRYLPNQNRKDDYRCFLIDWPFEEDRFVTGFKATPGNLRVAHHLVNFVVGPEAAEILRTISSEEQGPGHQCFGGPLPDRLGDKATRDALETRFPGAVDLLQRNNFWLSHWAPGMQGFDFPEDTGVLIRPGSVIVVQMHYYAGFAPGEADADTVMHFKVAREVSKPSLNFPLTNWQWLVARRNQSMTVPPGGSATYETGQSLETIAGFAARLLRVSPEEITGMEVHSANVHMHAFGASGQASLRHASGQKETLLRIPRWDLDWQGDFVFREPKVIPRNQFEGARLMVECTFVNPTNETVFGGYGSDDEMCFNFSYVSLLRGEHEHTVAMD